MCATPKCKIPVGLRIFNKQFENFGQSFITICVYYKKRIFANSS